MWQPRSGSLGAPLPLGNGTFPLLGCFFDLLEVFGITTVGGMLLKAFNPYAAIRITENRLPHWQQEGAVYFVSFRLGDSLPAIRILPAVAGAIEVWLAARMARELGGGIAAQILTALAVFAAPGLLAMDSFLSMNAFEPLFWLGSAMAVIRLINGASPRRTWLWFGLLAGLGLENKHSMLIFGFAILAGLMLTPERRLLRTPWFLAGGLLAGVVFLPNLLWNIEHGFPFLELQENIRQSGRNVSMRPMSFLAEEVLAMNPSSAPLWLAGLWYLFFGQHRFRPLGWACVITGTLIFTLNPRIYYLFPAFPILFAAGSVAWERWAAAGDGGLRRWIVPAYGTLLFMVGAMVAPMAMPLLPPPTFLRYSAWLGIEQPAIETRKLGRLPQLFADRFGWKELAETVAGVFHALPREIQGRTAIFGQHYGQAGAVDLFGPALGLPRAISGHQNYFLWGPGPHTGESVIVIGDSEENLKRLFARVERAASVSHPYSMPDQHVDIFYCQGAKRSLRESWPALKKWR